MQRLPSSFRDRSGFIFKRDGNLFRRINVGYLEEFKALTESGFFQRLWDHGLLIPHQEINDPTAGTDQKTIHPEQLAFVSYPYEWSFSQFKDAALVTLEIQKLAIEAGFTLKDASAYNIQFIDDRPVLIDTLSFETYQEGQPWIAYRQFCQHFLAPTALMAMTDVRLSKLARIFIDGIPLDLASRLLPRRSKLRPGLLFHIHLHARSQRRYTNRNRDVKGRHISKNGLLGIIGNLAANVRKLQWLPTNTEWGDYYTITNYSEAAFAAKKDLVSRAIDTVKPRCVWDLGANNGRFSRLASSKGITTVAWDIDPTAVELNYRDVRRDKESFLYPVIIDLSNPSPPLGWANAERDSFFARHGKPDLVLSLALIHHIAIGNNVPLESIASAFADLAPSAVVEFVPKSDSKVSELLLNREDIFDDYSEHGFETAFGAHFEIVEKQKIPESERVLYLFGRKN
jgi:ribosomal protein L11 methylase PrmA